MSRVRPSLQDVCEQYTSGEDRNTLENIVRAFRRLQQLDPSNEDSFFTIAGYHGEPWIKENPYPDGSTYDDWQRGYCQHQTVLFPTWHQAYLLRLEDAMRRAVPDAPSLALPFLDESRPFEQNTPLPWILTTPTFDLDGDNTNPLYSYKFQKGVADNHGKPSDAQRYSKSTGSQTARYPLAGVTSLDGKDPASVARILNGNIAAWLSGKIQIDGKASPTSIPDTVSIVSRYKASLDAPNYTLFSNKASRGEWLHNTKGSLESKFHTSLEDPHNAVHLAIGGFYQDGEENAKPVKDVHGDMGENETANFDPIFFLHHAFIDYVFWTWQVKHRLTKPGNLSVEPNITAATLSAGSPVLPPGSKLEMSSPLAPFLKSGCISDPVFHTSDDITDINQLGYMYGEGSLDLLTSGPVLGDPELPLVAVARVSGISTTFHEGSFVIRTSAKLADGREIEIDRDAILSRWALANCKNCQKNKLETYTYIPLGADLMRAIGAENKEDIHSKLTVSVQTRGQNAPVKDSFSALQPLIEIF
ncbi:putative tyrosinase [Colletotrichum lupini]|nr:putative tyrosinase [Colletotrichum lupini]